MSSSGSEKDLTRYPRPPSCCPHRPSPAAPTPSLGDAPSPLRDETSSLSSRRASMGSSALAAALDAERRGFRGDDKKSKASTGLFGKRAKLSPSRTGIVRAETPNSLAMAMSAGPQAQGPSPVSVVREDTSQFADVEVRIQEMAGKDELFRGMELDRSDFLVTEVPREDRLDTTEPLSLPENAASFPSYIVDSLAMFHQQSYTHVTFASVPLLKPQHKAALYDNSLPRRPPILLTQTREGSLQLADVIPMDLSLESEPLPPSKSPREAVANAAAAVANKKARRNIFSAALSATGGALVGIGSTLVRPIAPRKDKGLAREVAEGAFERSEDDDEHTSSSATPLEVATQTSETVSAPRVSVTLAGEAPTPTDRSEEDELDISADAASEEDASRSEKLPPIESDSPGLIRARPSNPNPANKKYSTWSNSELESTSTEADLVPRSADDTSTPIKSAPLPSQPSSSSADDTSTPIKGDISADSTPHKTDHAGHTPPADTEGGSNPMTPPEPDASAASAASATHLSPDEPSELNASTPSPARPAIPAPARLVGKSRSGSDLSAPGSPETPPSWVPASTPTHSAPGTPSPSTAPGSPRENLPSPRSLLRTASGRPLRRDSSSLDNNDTLQPEVVGPCSEEMRLAEQRARSAASTSLFGYLNSNPAKHSPPTLPQQIIPKECASSPRPPLIPLSPRKRYFLFKLAAVIHPNIAALPVQVFVSIYDLKAKRKLSEDLCLTWNSHLLPPSPAPETALQRGIFELLQVESEDLYLVARLFALGEDATKEKKDKDKKKERSGTLSAEAAIHAFTFRFPLAMGGVRLFKQGQKALPLQIALAPLVRGGSLDDESLYELLQAAPKKPDISLSFHLQELRLPHAYNTVVTNYYKPLRPFLPSAAVLHASTNTSQIIREVASFESDAHIHVNFFSHLYLSQLRLANLKLKSSLLLQLSVKFRDSDVDHGTPGLPRIYGSALQDKLLTEWRSTLVADTKSLFPDEIKVKLPSCLTEKHHLFLTLYGYNPKKVEERSILGHIVIPLVVAGRVTLPPLSDAMLIAQSPLPQGYLKLLPTLTADKDKHKQLLQYTQYLQSAVLSANPHLISFFDRNPPLPYPTANPKLVAISALLQVEDAELVRFAPAILNSLLRLIMSVHQDLAREAFIAFLKVTAIVDRGAPGSQGSFLRTFGAFIADPLRPMKAQNKPETDKKLHEALARWTARLLREQHAALESYRFMWLIFNLITRFAALHVHESKLLDKPRRERFPESFVKDISTTLQLFYLISSTSITDFTAIGGFVRDLFGLLDRGVVLGMFHTLLTLVDETGGKNVQSRKLALLKTASTYLNYPALNLPQPLVLVAGRELRQQVEDLKQTHFLVGALLQEVSKVYRGSDDVYDQVMRTSAITTLRSVLASHELDQRSQSPAAQQRICALYFPYVFFLVEDSSLVREMQVAEKEEWLSCFIYILRHLPTPVLRQWLQKETKKRQKELLILLEEAATVFLPKKAEVPEVVLQVNLVVIEVLSQYLEVQGAELNEDTGSSAFSNFLQVVNVFKALLFQRSEALWAYLRTPLHFLIEACPQPFFAEFKSTDMADYLEIIVFEIMLLCHSPKGSVRAGAVSILYKLLVFNFTRLSNILHVKTRITVAISSIVGKQEYDSAHLYRAFDSLLAYCRAHPVLGDDFISRLVQMVAGVRTLIQQTALIKENSGDPEMLAALYHNIANGFAHSPKLRLTWLGNLMELHVKNGQLLEAAQCKVYQAALVYGYLKRLSQLRHVPAYFESLFLQVMPCSAAVLAEVAAIDATTFSAESFNLQQLCEYLTDSTPLFDKASMYELCLEVYAMLETVARSDRQYDLLSKALDATRLLVARITDASRPPDRLVPVYFRVAFWGKKWGDDVRTKQFIYKKPTNFSLPVMKKQLEEQYSSKYKREVVVLSKSDKVDESQLDEEKLYIQLAGTKPYFTALDVRGRVSLVEQHFNVGRFLFESGVTDGGKSAADDLANQRKKKTVYVTRVPFPYVENRVEIVSVEEIIISPIQNAIELISGQTAKVQAELEAVPTRVNPLQQTLQGSVVPMVNPGPIKICEIFLNPQRVQSGEFPSEDVQELIEAMDLFIKKCAFAVRLNKYVMEEKHAKFTEMIEKSFSSLEVTVKAAIDAAAKALIMA